MFTGKLFKFPRDVERIVDSEKLLITPVLFRLQLKCRVDEPLEVLHNREIKAV